MECGIATRSFIHTQPDRTCKSLQNENKKGLTSLYRCGSFCKMQSRTSLKTASLLVRTAKNPSVNNCVKLFSNTSSFDSSKLGEFWPSFEEWVEFTAEFGVDWNVTLLWLRGVVGLTSGLSYWIERLNGYGLSLLEL